MVNSSGSSYICILESEKMKTDKIIKWTALLLTFIVVSIFIGVNGKEMSFPNGILFTAILFVIASIIVGGTLFNVFCLIQTCRGKDVGSDIKDCLRGYLLLVAFGLSFLLVMAVSGPHYSVPLVDMDTPYFHEVISSEYGYWYWLLTGWGFLALFVIRIRYKRLSPLVTVILFSFVFLQIACWVIYMIQLFEHIGRLSVQLAYFGFSNLLIYEVRVIISVIKAFPVEKYRNVAFSFPNRLLYNSRNWSWMALLLMFPVLAICMLLLCLFGQQPDSLVKAFTETSDWLLSRQVSPPKLPHTGHYLCTVSVQGHPKLVKPLRWGIRGGNRIWVNRQLLVANAFEQILEERIPRIHRVVRYLYDRYGYPIAKHITTPHSADAVYILMKPLEFFFLIVIYCFDLYPESRIARQYLPGSPSSPSNADE